MNEHIVFLAVAGAGKTYKICNSLDVSKRNLVLSFTNSNIANIEKELRKRCGEQPELTKVMTFDTFLLNTFIRPFIVFISRHFGISDYHLIKQISMDPIESIDKTTGKPDYYSISSTSSGHYFIHCCDGTYCLRLASVAELPINGKVFIGGKSLFESAMERLSYFYDAIYIDEFQDYRNYRFDLMVEVAQSFNKSYMFGDYYQHSASGQNNTGRPFDTNVGNTYSKFKRYLETAGFIVDETTLSKTRRCAADVCNFIRGLSNIQIFEDKEMGRIGLAKVVLDPEELKNIIRNEKPIVLSPNRIDGLSKGTTIGLSKGSSFDSVVCVFCDSWFSGSTIKWPKSPISANKAYVGLTRSFGNVYITKMDVLYKAVFQIDKRT